MCPSVSVYSRTVRQLLSGSLTHTRTKSLSTCVSTQMLRRASLFSLTFFHILLPTKMTSKLTLVFSLRYVVLLRLRLRLPLRLILRSALHLCRLSPFRYRYYTRHVLTARCCRRLILGYNRWYFISAHPAPLFCNAMSIC